VTDAEDRDVTPEQVEEADAQRYLEHEDPDVERDRAGLEDEQGGPTEPLPDERRDDV
jgi:hypothetical protein